MDESKSDSPCEVLGGVPLSAIEAPGLLPGHLVLLERATNGPFAHRREPFRLKPSSGLLACCPRFVLVKLEEAMDGDIAHLVPEIKKHGEGSTFRHRQAQSSAYDL